MFQDAVMKVIVARCYPKSW